MGQQPARVDGRVGPAGQNARFLDSAGCVHLGFHPVCRQIPVGFGVPEPLLAGADPVAHIRKPRQMPKKQSGAFAQWRKYVGGRQQLGNRRDESRKIGFLLALEAAVPVVLMLGWLAMVAGNCREQWSNVSARTDVSGQDTGCRRARLA